MSGVPSPPSPEDDTPCISSVSNEGEHIAASVSSDSSTPRYADSSSVEDVSNESLSNSEHTWPVIPTSTDTDTPPTSSSGSNTSSPLHRAGSSAPYASTSATHHHHGSGTERASTSRQATRHGAAAGEPASTNNTIPIPMLATWVTDRIHKHGNEVLHCATMTYDTFLRTIKELNKKPLQFKDSNGKELAFQLKKGTHSTYFWKLTVKILCHKINTRTGHFESTRQLNMKQYIHLYNEIVRLHSMSCADDSDNQPGSQDLTASTMLSGLDSSSPHCSTSATPHSSKTLPTPTDLSTELEVKCGIAGGGGLVEDDECCICMDRKAQIVLKCAHKYCEQCIEEWNLTHKSCPICRDRVRNSADAWVMTERPDRQQMIHETTGYLMDLADRTGVPIT